MSKHLSNFPYMGKFNVIFVVTSSKMVETRVNKKIMYKISSYDCHINKIERTDSNVCQ